MSQVPLSCGLVEDPQMKCPAQGSKAHAPAHITEPVPERQEDEGQRARAASTGVSL